MSTLSVKKLLEYIQATNLGDTVQIAACSTEEVKTIEVDLNLTLPGTYKEFLRTFGKSTDSSFLGEALFLYDGITLYQDEVDIDIRKNILPSSAYVFFIHDYLILYFNTEDGNDPPVYRLIENSHVPEKISNSFTEWLNVYVLEELNSYIKHNSTI